MFHDRSTTAAIAAALLATGAADVNAQPVTETRKLLGVETTMGDSLGDALAISGFTALVASQGANDIGFNSGVAYLFDLTTGSQLSRFAPADVDQSDNFGRSCDIDRNRLIVGSWQDDDTVINSGSAYIFDVSDPTAPVQTGKLHADTPERDDFFGFATAVSGDTAIVGAWGAGINGEAYLFDIETNTMTFKLLPPLLKKGSVFGFAVDIHNTVAVVGDRRNDDAASDAGAAHLFDTTTGAILATVTAPDANEDDRFGWRVAIHNDRLIACANRADIGGQAQIGAAYLYDIADPTDPIFLAKLVAPDGEAEDFFGSSVDLNDNLAVIGAFQHNEFIGAAYLFDASDGTLLEKLAPSDGLPDEQFGRAVAIDGGMVLVGAPDNAERGIGAGAAYHYYLGGPCGPADITDPFGILDLTDISTFIAGFTAQNPGADLNGDGTLDLADLVVFVAAFNTGCP
jgi:hypothetical protein